MPIRMPTDTSAVLEPDARLCDSRSLFLDRFANPEAREQENERKQWFTQLIAKPVALVRQSTPLPPGSPPPLYAQLQSRLMVNMAGGVMENAGLCLDRFGLPYIPGSAVKGCARRAALAALQEWTTTGAKPGTAPDDADNLFAEACRPFASPEEFLARIALVFGWIDSDWKDSRNKRNQPTSDFIWATEPERTTPEQPLPNPPSGIGTRQKAAHLLAQHLGISLPPEAPQPWTHLPSFAGSVGFLHASPVRVDNAGSADGFNLPLPAVGKLELDVLTCHHREYYGQRSATGSKPATDDEEPNPVFFPAIAAGHVFAFPVAPLRRTSADTLALASRWLALGLQVFGLGAKTAAGYGWFDASDRISKTVHDLLERKARHEAALKAAEKEAAQQKARQEAEQQRKKEEAEALASLGPEAGQDFLLARLGDAQFRSALESFTKQPDEKQRAIVRALRKSPEETGSRRTFWEELKSRAQAKGGKYGQLESAIRILSKQMFAGKEGKMP